MSGYEEHLDDGQVDAAWPSFTAGLEGLLNDVVERLAAAECLCRDRAA